MRNIEQEQLLFLLAPTDRFHPKSEISDYWLLPKRVGKTAAKTYFPSSKQLTATFCSFLNWILNPSFCLHTSKTKIQNFASNNKRPLTATCLVTISHSQPIKSLRCFSRRLLSEHNGFRAGSFSLPLSPPPLIFPSLFSLFLPKINEPARRLYCDRQTVPVVLSNVKVVN